MHSPEIHRLWKFIDGLHNLCTVQSQISQSADGYPFWKFIDGAGPESRECTEDFTVRLKKGNGQIPL